MELAVAFFVGLAACIGVTRFFSEQPRRRRIRLAPPKPITDAEEGGVISAMGQVRNPEGTLFGPLSGRECIAYRLRIKRVEDRHWLVDKEQCLPFMLEDKSGRARVEPDRADLHFEGEQNWDIVTLADHPRMAKVLERELGPSQLEELDDRPLLYREYAAGASGTAAVHGRVDFELDADPSATIGYRGRGTIPVFRASPDQPLSVVLDR